MNAAIRRVAVVLLIAIANGCASAGVNVAPVSLAPNASIDSTGSRIRLRMTVAPELAAIRVVEALVERDIPVSTNQGGVIEATLPRQVGLLGQYDIVIRAYVTPAEGGGSNVLLFGEEGIITKPDQPPVWYRISDEQEGRALATWNKLKEVGRVLGQ